MKGVYPYYKVEPITTIQDLFNQSCRKFKSTVALQSKIGGIWRSISYAELEKLVKEFSTGLIELGMKKGDKVGILSENRSGWAIAYLSVVCAGSIAVPIDKELKEQEIYHILHFSGTKFIITSSKYVDLILDIKSHLPQLQFVLDMDTDQKEGVLTFSEILVSGRERLGRRGAEFSNRAPRPEDIAAIIFTSGTMGSPKGVMLTHKNIAANVMDTCRSVRTADSDRFLSVLPLHHTYECTCGFLVALYVGSRISYCEGLRRIAENMSETKTTVMLGVPSLFEAMYRKIRRAIAEKGETKFKLSRAIASLSQKLLHVNIRRKLFKKVHERLGGHLRLLICGGAPLNPEVARGFRELGINFLQGYGLTEASPIIAVNRDKAFKNDSVGLPVAGVEVKISEDGEILARGDNIMLGYYNNPQATSEVLVDGCLYTGDLGFLDEEGFLHVQGRKKSVIVLPGGKKVYPEEVETELLKSPYILECLVWGGSNEQDPSSVEVQAIIVPNMETLLRTNPEGNLTKEKIEALINEEVKQRCANLALFKRVTKFAIREEEFDKTTTQKIKRYLYTGKAQSVAIQ